MEQSPLGPLLGASITSNAATVTKDFGGYELLEEIARGGMGIVYRARQKSLDRIVALKTILSGTQASKELVRRLKSEGIAAARLQHPNIVAVHEVGVHEGQHFLVMDFVDGPTLATFIRSEPLSARRAATYVKAIAEAIHAAHEGGVLHRDLKPSNVLVDVNDQPRVTDFGLARQLEGESSLTLSGQMLGSPNYMPPEQASSLGDKVTRRSDVYGLGAILYHLITGRPPFQGATIADTVHQVVNNEPAAPRLVNSDVPLDLETICLKCLEKEPARRYATAMEVANELGRFLNHEPIWARPVGRIERTVRWCRRRPGLAASTFAVALLGLIGAFGWTVAREKAQGEKRARAKTQAVLGASDQVLIDLALKPTKSSHDDEIVLGLANAIARQPTNPVLWRAMAVMTQKTNGLDEAYQHFSKAIELASSHHSIRKEILSNRCDLLRRMGRFPEAARDYFRTISLTLPGYPSKNADPRTLPDYSLASQVVAELGPTNRESGLYYMDVSDGRSAVAEVGEWPCRSFNSPTNVAVNYGYFYVDPTFKWACGNQLLVTVEYFDTESGFFTIDYHGTNGPFTQYKPAVRLHGTRQWRVATFSLANVRLINSQNGSADFRIGIGASQLFIRRVCLSQPPPDATTRIDLELAVSKMGQFVISTNAIEMFNGRDLEGWNFDPAVWSVRGGVIYGHQTRPGRGNGSSLFWRDTSISDFVLCFRFRLTHNNSGIYYRADQLEDFDVGGYEFEIYTNKTGNLANNGADRPRQRLYRAKADALPIDSEWHEGVILAAGARLIHVLDGKILCDVEDTDPAAPHSGAIALANSATTTVEFKDLRLRRILIHR